MSLCRVRKGALLASLLLLTVFTGQALADDVYAPNVVYLRGNYHMETRDLVGTFFNPDFIAGYDRLVWKDLDLYVGGRLGWYNETVCTAYMSGDLAVYSNPSFGLESYFFWTLFPNRLSATFGIFMDTIVNLDSVHSDPAERLYTMLGVQAGLRLFLPRGFFLDLQAEAAQFPFFSDVPVFLKAGVAAGIGF